jgi:hypothetical protein
MGCVPFTGLLRNGKEIGLAENGRVVDLSLLRCDEYRGKHDLPVHIVARRRVPSQARIAPDLN